MGITIDAVELARLIENEEPLTLLDVRWAMGDPHGRDHYRAAHLPGAVFVDLDTELAAPPSAGTGRHPLPSVAELEAAARRWGVRSDRPVIVYDATGNLAAARAWWLLRWAGHPRVLLLDGGLGAWQATGLPLESGDAVPPGPGDVTLRGGALAVADADGTAALAASGRGLVLDARSGERYRGETEPVDPRAGHIPGAVSAPTTENVAADGRFLTADRLRARFTGLGADGTKPIVVYCGSGITAAHEIAALAIAGIDATLYPGSWSQWTSDPSRPVATTERP